MTLFQRVRKIISMMHCIKCARIRVFDYPILPYKDGIVDSRYILIRVNSYSRIYYAVMFPKSSFIVSDYLFH